MPLYHFITLMIDVRAGPAWQSQDARTRHHQKDHWVRIFRPGQHLPNISEQRRGQASPVFARLEARLSDMFPLYDVKDHEPRA